MISPYERLANAIVEQAVIDYRGTEDLRARRKIERFFLSDWFKVLTKIDGRRLVTELRKEKVDAS